MPGFAKKIHGNNSSGVDKQASKLGMRHGTKGSFLRQFAMSASSTLSSMVKKTGDDPDEILDDFLDVMYNLSDAMLSLSDIYITLGDDKAGKDVKQISAQMRGIANTINKI